MDRVDYAKAYAAPDDYMPPEDKHLNEDTRYANQNSRDYRRLRPKRVLKHHEFYELLTPNESGLAVLATNNLRGRLWDGSIWGYENLNDITEEKACFKLLCQSTVTRISFVKDNVFVLGQMNGSVNIWSTRPDDPDVRGYSLSLIGTQTQHLGGVLSMDALLPNKHKVATGSNDCFLMIWDVGQASLACASSLRFAHADDIVSISSSPSQNEIFTTCSRDKSALIWDYRLPKPAKILCENHPVAFSSAHWCNQTEHQGNVLLGDESGYIAAIDPRIPNKNVFRIKVFDRPIRKISCRGTSTAVIGNTNVVRVYNAQNLLMYENQDATDFLRDVYWESDNLFYTVGWNRNFSNHSFDLKS